VASCGGGLHCSPQEVREFARPIRRQCRRRRARPRPKTATVERRKASVRFASSATYAPRLTRAAHSRGRGAAKDNKMRLSALRPPLGSVGSKTKA
jgi:hypothetical protein